MKKLGTFWVDYSERLGNFDKGAFTVKRARNTLLQKPGDVLDENEVRSLINRGYEVFIDKAK